MKQPETACVGCTYDETFVLLNCSHRPQGNLLRRDRQASIEIQWRHESTAAFSRGDQIGLHQART